MNLDDEALAGFTGEARLFPLPNLVLFPHVVQPLHIFEPRYRQLTADALSGDRLIAMALFQPGWEEHPEAPPELHPVACLGRITAHRRLEDGRFIPLLRGLSRLRLREELPTDRLYRIARAELMPDVTAVAVDEIRKMRRRLRDLIMPRFEGTESEREQLRELFDGEAPLPELCDNLCFHLPLTLARKIELLSEADVTVRVRGLLAALEAFAAAPRLAHRWPAQFSEN